jgi:hypothetical protein
MKSVFLTFLLLLHGLPAMAKSAPFRFAIGSNPQGSDFSWTLNFDKGSFDLESLGGSPRILKSDHGLTPSGLEWLLVEYSAGVGGTRAMVELDRLAGFTKSSKQSPWVRRFEIPVRIRRSATKGREAINLERSIRFNSTSGLFEAGVIDEHPEFSLNLFDSSPVVNQWTQTPAEEGSP